LPKSLGLVFQSANSFIVGNPSMRQLGLEVADCRLGFLKKLFSVLACGDLLAQGLPCRLKFVGADAVIVIPMNHGNRDLTFTNEPSLRPVWSDRWRQCCRPVWRQSRWVVQTKRTAHKRFGCLQTRLFILGHKFLVTRLSA
jgi:hypothetical protein